MTYYQETSLLPVLLCFFFSFFNLDSLIGKKKKSHLFCLRVAEINVVLIDTYGSFSKKILSEDHGVSTTAPMNPCTIRNILTV